jgi:hypothetical protein
MEAAAADLAVVVEATAVAALELSSPVK